jgi:hypothetical protein
MANEPSLESSSPTERQKGASAGSFESRLLLGRRCRSILV